MRYYLLFSALFAVFLAKSQTVIWTEDFEGANADWTLNTVLGPEGDTPNRWEISDDEGGVLPPGCGVGGNGNQSLYVHCNGGFCAFFGTGAIYYAGGLGDDCTTNKRAAYNQAISTVGHTNLTYSFDWIGNGQAGFDFATAEYSINGGTSWLPLGNFSAGTICGSGQGQWATASFTLPVTAENIADLRFAFTWVNNNDVIGSDPSFAVNNLRLTKPSSPTPPVANFNASTTTICEGDCISFTDASTFGASPVWDWNFGNSQSSSLQNPTNICYNTPGNYTVTLTLSDANGTDSEIKTNYITVHPAPDAGFDNNFTVCNTTNISISTLLNNADAGGIWQETTIVPSGQFNTSTSAFNTNGLTPGDYSFSYTVSGLSPCTPDVSNFIITVNDCSLPVANFNASSTTICEGDCISFTDASTFGASPVWDWNFGNSQSSSLQNPTNICYNTPGNYTVTLTLTDANGTDTEIKTNYITVHPAPDAGFDNNTSVCNNTNVTISTLLNNADAGGIWQETTIVPSGQFNTSTSAFNTNGLTPGDYSFIYTVSGLSPCTPDISNFIITVNDCSLPVANFNASSTTICTGESITFTDNSTGTNISTWSWNFEGGTPSTAVTQGPHAITFSTPGSYDIQLEIVDDNGTDIEIISIIVQDCAPPIAQFTFNSSSICESECLQLTNNSSDATSYVWTFNGGTPTSSTSQNPGTICFDNPGTFDVTLVATNQFGSDSFTNSITVHPAPSISASSDTIIELGASAQLNAVADVGIYSWTPTTDLSCSDCLNPIATPNQTTFYVISVTDLNGCTSQDNVVVTIDFPENIGVPNTFTPGPTGPNNILYVKGEGITSIDLKIYNRYGQLVFKSTDQTQGWDGTVNGKMENQGTFVYVLEYTFASGLSGSKNGNITLIR